MSAKKDRQMGAKKDRQVGAGKQISGSKKTRWGYNKAADGKRQPKRECKDRRGDVKRQAKGCRKTGKG